MKAMRLIISGIALGAAFMVSPSVHAQIPPAPDEIVHYRGLHAAAQTGDLAAIRRLWTEKSNFNARDRFGRTPLHVATFAKQREAIRLLIEKGSDPSLLENDRYDAVTIAAVADDEESLRLLLALGASAKLVTSRYDGSALIAAAHLGHDGVVRQLIAAGALLDHVNNLHWTAAIEAVVLGDGGPRHQATLSALIDAGANLQLSDRNGNTPLMLAKQRGYVDMAKMLEAANR